MLSEEIAALVGEQAAEVVEKAVEESRPEIKGWLPTSLGIATLVIGAAAMFGQMQESLNGPALVERGAPTAGIRMIVALQEERLAVVGLEPGDLAEESGLDEVEPTLSNSDKALYPF